MVRQRFAGRAAGIARAAMKISSPPY